MKIDKGLAAQNAWENNRARKERLLTGQIDTLKGFEERLPASSPKRINIASQIRDSNDVLRNRGSKSPINTQLKSNKTKIGKLMGY